MSDLTHTQAKAANEVTSPDGTEIARLARRGESGAVTLATLKTYLYDPVPTWSPADLPDLNAWYRTDQINETGGAVDSWPDQSGNGYDLTPNPSAPTVLSAALNGHDTINFVAASTQALQNVTANPILPTPCHTFLVMKRTADAAQRFICPAATNTNDFYTNATTFNLNNGVNWNNTGKFLTVDVWGVASFFSSGVSSTSEVRANQDAPAVGDAGTLATANGLLVGKRNGNSSFASMEVAEIIISTAKLSPGDEASLFAYIDSRYGLST